MLHNSKIITPDACAEEQQIKSEPMCKDQFQLGLNRQLVIKPSDFYSDCSLLTLDQHLKDDYKVKIQNFKDYWTQLHLEFGVPVNNKCHIIFELVEDFIEVQKKPLGEFSEHVNDFFPVVSVKGFLIHQLV